MTFYSDFYKNLINHLDFPKEAEAEFTALVKYLDENLALGREINKLIMRFMYPKAHDIRRFLEKLTPLSKEYSVNEHTLQFVFLLLCAEILYKRYKKHNISDEIFYDTLKDLTYKLSECIECKGYNGTFVPHWFEGFYRLERFALGRFQYEFSEVGSTINMPDGTKIKKGARALFVHIPSSGIPLTDDVRNDSYNKACEFFKNTPFCKNNKIIFICHSWLLFKKHYEFLPESSNILKFMNDFYIYDNYISETNEDIWRIFGKYENAPINELPEDTSLKRAYKKFLAEGNKTGGGAGIFIKEV